MKIISIVLSLETHLLIKNQYLGDKVTQIDYKYKNRGHGDMSRWPFREGPEILVL